MKRKITILGLTCMAIMLAGRGTMWGQWLYPQRVNNAFGAGESSYITPGNHAEQKAKNPWDIKALIGTEFSWVTDHMGATPSPYPGFSTGMYEHALRVPPADIVLGDTAINTVIKAYTGNGYALGWISVLNRVTKYNNTSSGCPAVPGANCDKFGYPDPVYENNTISGSYTEPTTFCGDATGSIYEFSFNKFNIGNFGAPVWVPGTSAGSDGQWGWKAPCGWALFQAKPGATPFEFEINTHIRLRQWGSEPGLPWDDTKITAHARPSSVPYGLYTSTVNGYYEKEWNAGHYHATEATKVKFPMDDGIPLVQFSGLDMTDGAALHNQPTYRLKSDAAHPTGTVDPDATTPAQWGEVSTTQNTVYLSNYRRPTTIIIQGGMSGTTHTFDRLLYKDIKWKYDIDTVKAIPQFRENLSECCSGSCSAYEFSVEWKAETVYGATLVDGAIALQPNAWVCVENDVTDATATPATEHTTASAPDNKTDAILVVPNITGRFTLRVKGDINNINMAQDTTGRANPFYTQATFPKHADNIYLYQDANHPHPFASAFGGLGEFAHTGITKYSIPAPTNKAEASVFGVYGNYNWIANNAKIHTDTASTSGFKGNVPGVIEVGPNTVGKKYYNVYSGGILKNFESCTDIQNFIMSFGLNHGDAPHFALTEKQPLNILNYGNNASNLCDADIHFYGGSTDSLKNAFAHATGDGAMRIQALSDVELRADAAIDAGLRGNNLYMLSDGGNVVTQTFSYKAEHQTDTARGLLTLWAEDRQPGLFGGCANDWATNRNSSRGNVYINDSIKVERPATPAQGGFHTETNMIAANNIRTASFKFESENLDHDTTNIISRKGDVWLGYSIGAPVYDATGTKIANTYKFSDNTFTYKVNKPTNAGVLNIKAGWDETDNGKRWEGGNIYFTSIKTEMTGSGAYPTNITIPFSNEYYCGSNDPVTGNLHERRGEEMQRYEHAGIIGGVGRCGREQAWSEYEGKFTNSIAVNMADQVTAPALNYQGNNGDLTVDAGQRGNIIMNTGTEMNFQNDNGSAFFRTRFGDIDLRGKTNIRGLKGNLLLLAQTEDLGDLSKVGFCGCTEERNNVYVQDMAYTPNDSGSIFIAADNNIKLNYGGLQNKGTRHDPFLSTDFNPLNPDEKIGTPYPCNNGGYHCDMVDDENKARVLMLNFSDTTGGMGPSFRKGGFAAVASDYIDVYKKMVYIGGQGAGIGSVPRTGTLHGESVAGYGLYMKTQGNKNNWNTNIFKDIPKCPKGCAADCDAGDYLHMVSRMTFHSDARIYAHDQKVYLGSPVIEVFGDLELNMKEKEGSRTEIVVQADSLILHDSLIVSGDKLKYRSWSGINGDKPILKLGYSRRTPPMVEYKYKDTECAPCHSYIPGSKDPLHMLDTITVKFKYGDAFVERFNTMVFDHTVLTFVTDSFDHVQGPPILHARYFVDTLRVRNQVALYADKKHELDAHFELISEEQMSSKKYAGVYTRHYHMEPIGACGRNYSELWLSDDLALDVITTSTFGGFGYQHSDVHVENMAHLNPGFTSLRLRGQCYEQKCGTLKMKDLRLDGGAQLHFSVGTTKGWNGEYSDAINVERLTTYGTIDVNIEIRPCERMQNRCYPIIYYQSVTPGSLNNLKLEPSNIKIDGEIVPLTLDVSQEGVVYLCVGNAVLPKINYSVTIPSVTGVTTTPPAGIAYTPARSNFEFKAKYSFEKPFVVRTDRKIDGKTEEILEGKKNANGEYEYVIPQVTQHIVLKFGPDHVANMSIEGTAIWSHGETIYIRVERKDIASIYSVAGQLVRRIELSEGDTSVPMQRGVYVVTLKDGTVHKVIVK